jgi:predicted ATPase
MLTDIEGSTSMWEKEAAPMASAVERHEEIVSSEVAAHGGQVVKARGEGDALFCVFGRPEHAVASSIAIQRALSAADWPTAQPLRVRIAIHLGEVEGRDGDYFGPTVNRCARLRAAGHGGQIIVSERVYAECAESADFIDHGRHRLKDLLRPEHVYEVSWSQTEFPPLRSLNALDHNLPIQLTSFVGRESDIAALERSLSEARLVTLTGSGGTGKTRLSLQVAAHAAGSGFQTVRFVSLSGLPIESDVAAAIAKGLGVPTVGAEDPLTATIAAYGSTNALIVVDNCEHVIESVATSVLRLLSECPNIRVLATSRERIGLNGEKVVVLGPLSLPAPDETHPVQALQSEAVALLIDRIRLKGGQFALDSASTPGVVRLTRALGGIPLAVEQAAARIATLGLDAVIERLGDRLDMLSSKDRDIEPRHRTVRATIAWSHDLLSSEEKRTFAYIATFQGAFLLKEASELVGREVVDEVESLAHKSLLSAVELSSHERAYQLLDTLRDYGRERIPEDAPGAFDSHTVWCSETADRLNGLLVGETQAQALFDLDRLYPDLMEGVRRTVAARSPLALPLAFAMRRAWLLHGPTTDGVAWLDAAVMDAPHDDRRLVADAHNALGAMANACGHHAKALEHLETARRAFDELGDLSKVGAAYVNLGITFAMDGSYASARESFEAGIAAYRKTTDERGLAAAHLNFGRMLLDSGSPEDAAAHYDQALRYYEGSDPLMETTILTGLAEIHVDSAPQRALDSIERALQILRRAHDPSKLGMALVQLAGVCVRAGLFEDSAYCAAAARGVTERLGAAWSAHAGGQLASLDATLAERLSSGDSAMIQARARSSTYNDVIEHALGAVVRVRSIGRT